MAFVLVSRAAAMADGVGATKRVIIPRRGRRTCKRFEVEVPSDGLVVLIMLLPDWARVANVVNCAASKVAVARADSPPSRAVMRFSKTLTVGLWGQVHCSWEVWLCPTYVGYSAVRVAIVLFESKESRSVRRVIEAEALEHD